MSDDIVKRLGRTWMREARGERYMAFRSGGLQPAVDGQSTKKNDENCTFQ